MSKVVFAMVVAGIKATHEAGDAVCVIDVTRDFDMVAATAAGAQTDRLLFSQPDEAAQAAEIIECLARSGAISLVMVLGDAGDLSKAASIAKRTGTRIVQF